MASVKGAGAVQQGDMQGWTCGIQKRLKGAQDGEEGYMQ